MPAKDQNSSYDGWDNDKILVPESSLLRDMPPSRQVYAENRVWGILYRPASVGQWEEAQHQVRAALGRVKGFDSHDEGALRIYDTLTREKREFVPVRPGKAGLYVCGMTVQDKPHVGHIRSSLSGDLMRRYLTHLGYEVTYVYNFTDVDDRIIDKANKEGIEYGAVSQRNIDAYLKFADLHNIQRASHYPRATEHIAEVWEPNEIWRAFLNAELASAR